MPQYTVDLHNHTPLIPTDYRGDVTTTPREIVERALEAGIDVWGIADHWSVAYGHLVVAAAEEVFAETGRRLLVLPGAELRIRHLGEETHMVALFPPHEEAGRFDALLSSLGLRDPVAPLDQLPFFAHDRDPLEVARLVNEAGGLCHIGHVDRTFGEYCFIDSDLVHELAQCEHVAAVELIDRGSRERFGDGLGITHIFSSDSHSLEEIGRRTTALEMPELSFEGLRSAFSSAGGQSCAVRGLRS